MFNCDFCGFHALLIVYHNQVTKLLSVAPGIAFSLMFACRHSSFTFFLFCFKIWLVLWFLTPLQQYFSYIVVVSSIGGGNRSTRRKPLICLVTDNLYHIMLYRIYLSMNGIRTHNFNYDRYWVCTGSCKSNYHTIMTAPKSQRWYTSP